MNAKREKTEKIIWTMIFLFAAQFMLQGSLILLFVFLIFVFIYKGRIRLANNKSSFLLIAFFVTYFVFYMLYGSPRGGLIALGCPLGYFIGGFISDYYNNIKDDSCDNNDIVIKLIYILASGGLAHVLLNFAYNLSVYGSNIFSQWKQYDFWSRDISTATGQMVNATIFVGTAYYAVFLENKKKIRFIFLVTLLLVTMYDILLGGRTFIFLLAINLLVGIISHIFVAKKQENKKEKSKAITRFLIIVLIFSVIGLIIFIIFREQIVSSFEKSYFFHRFYSINAISDGTSLFDTARTERRVLFFSNMLNYPWGGNHLFALAGGRAHELWLDVFDQVGIIPYTFLVLYFVSSGIRCLKYSKSSIAIGTRVLVLSFYITLIAQFFVEPILSGGPILLFSYCMIDGFISKQIKKQRYTNT